jgi:LCP family protein required for cell wall assembly
MDELDLLTHWDPEPAAASSLHLARDEARRRLTARYDDATPTRLPAPLRTRFTIRVLVAAVVASALVAASIAVARRLADDAADEVHTISVPGGVLRDGVVGAAPVNVLIVGSDTRAFVHDEQGARAFGSRAVESGQRSDTMILLRIEGANVRAMWIPRDLLRPDGTTINAAFNAGPEALISAIGADLHVPIDHYVQIDFPGFVKLVDAVGGVRIATAGRVRDPMSGLDLPGGCTTLNGAQALAWTRSRHVQRWDGNRWQDASPNADLTRIADQQAFLTAFGRSVRAEVGDDPVAAVELAGRLLGNVTADSGLSRSETMRLVRALVPSGAQAPTFETLPVVLSNDEAHLDQAPEAAGALAPYRGEKSSGGPGSTPTTALPPPAPVGEAC